MRRIALLSLIYDHGKLIASVTGVTIAAVLLLVQIGMYEGMRLGTSAIINDMGGDLWVMAKGTEFLENAEILSPSVKPLLQKHICVKNVRELIYSYALARKDANTLERIILVGADNYPGFKIVPRNLEVGIPRDLQKPMGVTVDKIELEKLHITSDPMYKRMDINGQTVKIIGVTKGIKSFTLNPFMFTSINNARAMLKLNNGYVSYIVASVQPKSCIKSVVSWINSFSQLHALPKNGWIEKTEGYWLSNSGIGIAMTLVAFMGLIVGIVVVGQTLYSLMKEHFSELAMLKVMGATSWELIGFVAWQVIMIAGLGTTIGILLAMFVKHSMQEYGLDIVLNTQVLSLGVSAIFLMCVLSGLYAILGVCHIKGTEVF